ncbi:hypothetical protein ABK040_006112 [Willaertia magna]
MKISSINLPDEKLIGHIIGKGGSQLKQLKSLTNSNIKIIGNLIIIENKKKDKLNRTIELINIIINNALSVYVHPNIVCNVYLNVKFNKDQNDTNKDNDDKCLVKLVEYKPFVYGCEKIDRKLFILCHANNKVNYLQNIQNTNSNDLNKEDLNNENFKSLITPNKVSHTFIYSNNLINHLIQEGIFKLKENYNLLQNVNNQNLNNNNKLKHLIKLSLGKKTFYNATRNDFTINNIFSFETFKNLEIGFEKDLKSTWKSEVSEQFIEKLKLLLNEKVNNTNNNNKEEEELIKQDNNNEINVTTTSCWELKKIIERFNCHYVEVINSDVNSQMENHSEDSCGDSSDESSGSNDDDGKKNLRVGVSGRRLHFKLIKNNENQLKLLKVRTNIQRLLFLDICHCHNIEDLNDNLLYLPDMRIRFETEQYYKENNEINQVDYENKGDCNNSNEIFKKDNKEDNSNKEEFKDLRKFISFLTFDKEVNTIDDSLVPLDLKNKFRKDMIRFKRKEIYTNNNNLKITISTVYVNNCNWYEVQLSFNSAIDNHIENCNKEKIVYLLKQMITILNKIEKVKN